MMKFFGDVGRVTSNIWLDFSGDQDNHRQEFLPLQYMDNGESYLRWIQWPWQSFALSIAIVFLLIMRHCLSFCLRCKFSVITFC